MNRQEHLLSCLAEECTEVGQRVSKALRFGLAEVQPGQSLTNAERIMEEFTDLVSVVEMLIAEGVLQDRLSPERVEAKQTKIEKFLAYAASVGALQT